MFLHKRRLLLPPFHTTNVVCAQAWHDWWLMWPCRTLTQACTSTTQTTTCAQVFAGRLHNFCATFCKLTRVRSGPAASVYTVCCGGSVVLWLHTSAASQELSPRTMQLHTSVWVIICRLAALTLWFVREKGRGPGGPTSVDTQQVRNCERLQCSM